MGKRKMLKIIIFCGLLIILFGGSVFGTYEYNQQKRFNNLVRLANQKLYAGDYDGAIKLYNEALSYKNDNDVKNEILLAQGYKQYKSTYNEGLKLMNDKKYSEAIQKFSTISQNSGQIYSNAQNEIAECKKNITSQNINTDSNIAKTPSTNNQQDNNQPKTVKSKANNSQNTIQNNYKSNQQSENGSRQNTIDNINNELARQHYITESSAVGSDKRINSIKEEINLLKEKEKVLQQN